MIGVDEERLRGEGLTPNEAYYLQSLKDGKEDVVLGKMSNVSFLKEMDYLSSEGKLTAKSIKFLAETFKKITIKKTVGQADVSELVKKFRDLFPAKIKTANTPVKSNEKNLIVKMIKFKKEYPKITDETILAATAKYVEGKRKEGYAFMTVAENLIYKNQISQLATLCDSYVEDGKDGREVKWGRSIS